MLEDKERKILEERLYAKYAGAGWRQRLVYLRKKYCWIIVTGSVHLLKRAIDIIVAASMLILLFPLMLIIALAIKLTDGGPVFYSTKRVGKWGKEFWFPKFRSMKLGASAELNKLKTQSMHKDPGTFKMRTDPRVTRVGAILRKTSMDELPQLWCVLKGDMSLVGPRPPLPEEVDNYTLDDRRRLDVTPGLTCIWQVSGRSELPFNKQVKLDREYIESQSLWLDIKLLLKTIPAVFFGRGAY